MSYAISMLLLLTMGAISLMGSIILIREPGQSISNTLYEGYVWGLSFVVVFSVEFWALAHF